MGKKLPTIMEQNSSSVSELASRVIELRPSLFGKEQEFRKFCRSLANLIKKAPLSERHHILEDWRERIRGNGNGISKKPEVALKFSCSVVIDMVAQGWELNVSRKKIEIKSLNLENVSRDEIKQHVREGHLLERDAQLRERNVQEFIKNMEQKRLGPKGWVSIYSLMRDGRELAQKLLLVSSEQKFDLRLKLTRGVIAPYLQLVQPGLFCEFTGIKLTDMWRYFRHTWVSTYKSLPGRSMMVLVRDAATPYHSVIGIAALGSSMAQQTLRDQWIGWDSDTFLTNLTAKPSLQICRWIHESVKRLIKGIYLKDLLSEEIIDRQDLGKPTAKVIKKLLRESEKSKNLHRLDPNLANHKKNANLDWERQAKTFLFRSKRTKTLSTLLSIRAKLQEAGFNKNSIASLKKLLADQEGRDALRQLIRLVKAEHVGVDMMDIIICGAIAPYNALLGGKLVCLLLASTEIIKFYRKRYAEQASVIASSIKGKSVVRTPNLVLLATTSLYGVGSSQYNRIRVPLEAVGGKTKSGEHLEYSELGISRGYGSYHFSQTSIDYLETLLGRAGDGRKVNSIFGEGVNPLMRKLRDGLSKVGLPTDDLLRHGNSRVVYGVPLAENFRKVLIGLDKSPRYFLSIKKAEIATQNLGEFWKKRWLNNRITRPDVIAAVKSHTLTYPVNHGARVVLPEPKNEV